MSEPMPAVVDGGWGWVVLFWAFLGQMLYMGGVPNVGIYFIEWEEHFAANGEEIAIIATLIHVGYFLTCKNF